MEKTIKKDVAAVFNGKQCRLSCQWIDIRNGDCMLYQHWLENGENGLMRCPTCIAEFGMEDKNE